MANLLDAGRAAQTASKIKKLSTPAQRAFGGGRQIGKKIGRKQGAAVGATAGLTVAGIREMTNRNELEKLKQENITATQKAAIEETLRKLAQEELKNKRSVGSLNQSPRPKLRPEGLEGKAKGGAVKLSSGGTSDPAWLKAMKKEAAKLGLPLRELLTMHNNSGPKEPKSKDKKASTMKAAKGGYSKKK